MKLATYFIILETLACMSCLAQAKKAEASVASSPPKLEQMPESLEIRFALSAAPPHLRDAATTYVLDPAKGFVLGHKGTNGLTCIVVRTDWQFANQPFRDDVFWPVCYDTEGSTTLLQDYIYAAELRARGMDMEEVHQAVTKRLGTAAYANPSRSGVAYMIAPLMRGYTKAPEPVTMNMPHYMFYAPKVKDIDIGGNGFSKQYPFILSMSPGRDDYIIVLGLIVRDKVKSEKASENQKYIQKVFEELHRTKPSGLRYASFMLSDGVSFVHIVSVETADDSNPLISPFGPLSFLPRSGD